MRASYDPPAYLGRRRSQGPDQCWRLALQVSLPVLHLSSGPWLAELLVAVSEKVPLALRFDIDPATLDLVWDPSPEPLYVPLPRNVLSDPMCGLRMSV